MNPLDSISFEIVPSSRPKEDWAATLARMADQKNKHPNPLTFQQNFPH